MTKPVVRDLIYRRRRFDAEIIELCVRWYITYRLSYRDLQAMMAERGIVVSHSTVLRWVSRYADDGVVHCQSEEQAQLVLRDLGERLRQCGLELHPEKTRIVYCQDVNRTAQYPTVKFTFLGYTFQPRKAVDKYGRVYVNFSPAVSRDAMKAMRQRVRGWHLQLKCDKELSDLSSMFGPVLRGWATYYGRFYPTALKPLWRHVNDYLVRWMQRKYKRLARGVIRAVRARGRLAEKAPRSFVHWERGFAPAAR